MKQSFSPLSAFVALSMSVSRKHLAAYSCLKSKHDYTQVQLMACLLLKLYLKTDYRGVCDVLANSDKLCRQMGLERVPHFTTIQKFAQRIADPALIEGLLATVLEQFGQDGEPVAMDSTGMDPRMASVHFRDKTGRKIPETATPAKKLLDAVPPSQLETLRKFAAGETDLEVKARLDRRVAALEGYVALHPFVSLHAKNATLASIVKDLDRQTGFGDINPPTKEPPGNGFTVDCDDAPYWQVVSQLFAQRSLTVVGVQRPTPRGGRAVYRINAGTMTDPVQFYDAFAYQPHLFWNANDTVSLSLQVNCDPRVNILRYMRVITIDKIIDQDGIEHVPRMINQPIPLQTSAYPQPSFPAQATFDHIPGLRRIAELRARFPVTAQVSEVKSTLHLKDPLKDAPVSIKANGTEITLSPVSVDGVITACTLQIAAAQPASTEPRYVLVGLFKADGTQILQDAYATNTSRQITLQCRDADTAEIYMPDRVADVDIPIVLKNLNVQRNVNAGP